MLRRLLRTLSVRRSEPDTAQDQAQAQDQDPTQDVDEPLVAILADIPRLQRLDGRHDLLQQAGPQLRLAVAEHRVARDHLRAVVGTARRTGTLEALQGALLALEPDDVGADWFNLAVTVQTAPSGPLPADFMMGLIGELRRQPQGFGQQAMRRYLPERRLARRPLEPGSLPHVLFQLYDARTTPSTTPGTPGASDTASSELRYFLGLLAEEATTPELTSLLASVQDPAAAPAPAPTTRTERQVIVQVRVEEEGAPSDLPYTRRQYSLRGYCYERVGDDEPAFRGSKALPGLFTGRELDRHGFLAAWQDWAESGWGVTKRVEFLLPHSLLNHPAEAWPSGPADVELSHTCQVVVRSLTRYKDKTVHDPWLRRWAALDHGCPPGDALERIGWMGPDASAEQPGAAGKPWSCPGSRYPSLRLTHPADVGDWLRAHPDLACLGLGTPYDHDLDLLRDAVRDALLLDGIPVMVWRRDEGDPGPLVDVLRDCHKPDRLADLPHTVHEARRQGRRDPRSVHNQISLLWDDPTCVFTSQDQQMTGTRVAGEGAA
ncbi:VMAP-C domain-containing protein [Streptomyces dysideae]|uniref:Uncharacterized protein n=1 Tax=Streptomyces dysideae TaxID=909626 RepID=A0A124IEP6_9ACTN|nr:hypothetical protein [Streptomyces dysideae]KUO18936.1 hypothetical protein AQJ91_22275 [Streptomyces dysideae]